MRPRREHGPAPAVWLNAAVVVAGALYGPDPVSPLPVGPRWPSAAGIAPFGFGLNAGQTVLNLLAFSRILELPGHAVAFASVLWLPVGAAVPTRWACPPSVAAISPWADGPHGTRSSVIPTAIWERSEAESGELTLIRDSRDPGQPERPWCYAVVSARTGGW